jgi:acyl carrier protein
MAARQPKRKTAPASAPSLEQVSSDLRALIEENAGIPASLIRDDSRIDGDLEMDSMSFVSLQVAVEDHFDIRCGAEDLEALLRFDAIAAMIHERMETDPADRQARKKPARRRPAARPSRRSKRL